MVTVTVKFKKGKTYGQLSGRTDKVYFRTVKQAEKYKKFLHGSYTSATITTRRARPKQKTFNQLLNEQLRF